MIYPVKVDTLNQFKLIQYARENFKEEAEITVKLYNADCIMLTEKSGEYCYLTMMADGTVDAEFHYGR